jgi:predicted kinase
MDFFIEQSPRLFILAGIPGCGKSTWARTFFPPWVIVSSDAIREEKWPGEPYDAERNLEVFDEFHQRLSTLLDEGKDAVADATSLAYQARWRLCDLANFYGVEKHLIFFNNHIQALRRNAQRTGAACVPDEEQDVMLVKLKESRSAIFGNYESYDSITIIQETK